MTDIVTFLTARLDEDQAAAEVQPPWPWRVGDDPTEVIADDDIEVATAFALSGNQQRNVAAHIARHDPARVLAEVAAKRAILEQWRLASDDHRRDDCDEGRGATWAALSIVLVSLASAYLTHPDYKGHDMDGWEWPDDESWRP